MNRRRFLANGMGITAVTWATSDIVRSSTLPSQNSGSPERIVKLAAKPARIDINLARTAVVVVDMTNDFCSIGGCLDREGVDMSITRRAIAPTRRVLSAARKVDVKIVYLKMGFRPDLSDVGTAGSRNWINNRDVGTKVIAPNGEPSRVLIRNTWNTDIITELRPEPADTLIFKNRFSGFYQTDLDALLKG
jgi:ureidoacrylate peracid hydrolase